jgi:signal transduction histidine kinase
VFECRRVFQHVGFFRLRRRETCLDGREAMSRTLTPVTKEKTTMLSNIPIDSETLTRSQLKIETLEQQASDLARSVETVRQQTLAQSNERIEALEEKARNLAWFVETTRQQTLLQSDKKTEALEQKARDLANFVETLRNQTRLQSETEIEALGQQARELALFVETVRKETRLQSEAEIATLRQQALDLAVSLESVREETLLQSETEIAALGKKARDLAVCVETVREETLLHSDTEIAALGQQARDLAVSVESVREETLLQSDTEIKELKQQARNLAFSVEQSRIETLMESDKVIRKLNADLEQRVLERTGQLEAANKELESFSYSVSHDLRAPLRAIAGFSRILLEEYVGVLPEDGKGYLKLIGDNTRQMAQLVDDLLAFSRLGRLALTKQTVDPNKIVRLCLTEMQKEQEGRQLQLEIGDLPFCQADPTLLKQVWMNLLSNALKYTRKKEAVHIVIGTRTQPRPLTNGLPVRSSGSGTETVYFVTDNGAGFDMKYANKLFGVFQRLHRAADYDGTGVGLAIVQRIINRHGGRVWAEAKLNLGATFSFTLD